MKIPDGSYQILRDVFDAHFLNYKAEFFDWANGSGLLITMRGKWKNNERILERFFVSYFKYKFSILHAHEVEDLSIYNVGIIISHDMLGNKEVCKFCVSNLRSEVKKSHRLLV